MNKFTAEEVRMMSRDVLHASVIDKDVSVMLTELADRIEADKTAVIEGWKWESFYQHVNQPRERWHERIDTDLPWTGDPPKDVRNVRPLFTHPPAQAAQVPDKMHVGHARNTFNDPLIHDGYVAGWNACRAAMLDAPTAESVARVDDRKSTKPWAEALARGQAVLAAAKPVAQGEAVACIDHRHLQILRKSWDLKNCLKHPDDAARAEIASELIVARHQLRNTVDDVDLALMGVV